MFNFFKKKTGTRQAGGENLQEILSQFKDLKENLEKLSQELEKLKRESKFSIQRVGIVRFNPFKEIGGNQSFSVAFLDGKDNGVIITNLFTREGNRVFAKPIKNGKSEHLLSDEEKEAIEKAKSSQLEFQA
jgi:hypothetical protein